MRKCNVVLPIDTANYNRNMLKNILNFYMKCEKHIILMGNGANSHKSNVPAKIGTVITINEDFNFARCMSGSIKLIKNQIGENDLTVIANPYYVWSYIRIYNSLIDVKFDINRNFIYFDVIDDRSGKKEIDLSVKNIMTQIGTRVDYILRSNKYTVIDQLYMAKFSFIEEAINNLSDKLNNFKMRDIKEEFIRMKILPIKSNLSAYSINKSSYKESSNIETTAAEKNQDQLTIEYTKNNEKIGILLPFLESLETSPKYSGFESSWKELIPLLDKTGIFNIYIYGKYPFPKEALKNNCQNVWFMEDHDWIKEDKDKLDWGARNSKLVFGFINNISSQLLKSGVDSFLIGRNSDKLENPKNARTKFIDTPNPKFDGVDCYKKIRTFLGY